MTIEKFIEFVIDLANDLLYEKLDGDAKYYFLNGGCYQIAKVLQACIPKSKIVINDSYTHCGIYYDGDFYDANGIVSKNENFKIASKEDIGYMEEKFGIPEKENINGDKISIFLINELKECRILDKLELDEFER